MFGGMIASNDKALRVRDNDSRIQRLQDRRDVRAHVLGLAEVLAKAGIGLGQFEIHLLKPGRQRIIRLLKDRRSLVKVLKGAREEIIVRLVSSSARSCSPTSLLWSQQCLARLHDGGHASDEAIGVSH